MKNEASKAIKRIDRIIWEWEENRLDAYEALEMIVSDLKTIICYVESIQDEVVDIKKRNHN